MALYQNNKGEKGLIFGYILTPGGHDNPNADSLNVAALNIETQEVMWDTQVLEAGYESTQLQYHGVLVEGEYAYGGISSSANMDVPPVPWCLWRGIAFKLDINTGELLHTFKTLPDYSLNLDEMVAEGWYLGASVWPQGGGIDDYFVFGTGQLYTYPGK